MQRCSLSARNQCYIAARNHCYIAARNHCYIAARNHCYIAARKKPLSFSRNSGDQKRIARNKPALTSILILF